MSTARSDDDSWEITESVGATALGVASARAAETRSENPLIKDPFAQVFLDAAGDGVWNWHSAPQLPPELIEAEPTIPLQQQAMVGYMASRTAFFDSFFLEATGAGIRQAVILAAGLDARSWRLPWPAGTTVYELDQPRVLEFKESTLAEHGAQPACNRVAVPVDLRHDWPEALRQAGFDASAPSVWSAEGLMPYLPAAAQDLLFDRIQGLTVAGSRVAVEALGPKFLDPQARAKRRERMDRIQALMARIDPDRAVPRTDELWYFEEREDVGEWFGRHGWDVRVTPSDELMAGYGRGRRRPRSATSCRGTCSSPRSGGRPEGLAFRQGESRARRHRRDVAGQHGFGNQCGGPDCGSAQHRRAQVDHPAQQRGFSDDAPDAAPAERGEPGERGGQVVRLVDARGQHRGVLEPLATALTQVRAHRMSRVADHHDGPARPGPGGGAVVKVVAQHLVAGRRCQHPRNRFGPIGESCLQIGQFAARRELPFRSALGGEPIQAIRTHRHMAGFDAGTKCLAGQLGVHRRSPHRAMRCSRRTGRRAGR
uniref:Putative S-adenosyl-L-methionine-dependent methyltransferase MAP_4079 n=1 Tax=Mycolicibacterium paratuberculosis (strain ATCC BAA-968 / K-10) TaxID=262316 RepID=Y4079_MYCPA|nr:RecName: Full=Putative S-adenosyl-L-methionine-dependent methyltransferase MAP_4079 [Mycobacterium avium subsp. paratuberculosis K-10]